MIGIGAATECRHQRIVVGVDGSRAAQAALTWAARLARLIDAKVDAVLVWGRGPGFAAEAEAALLRSVMALPDHLRGVVRTETIRDYPADALVDAGRSADMVVVGTSRGGHHLPHVLGSVSRHVALRATVPVVVTPGPAPQP
jgi:nucleotide-binding universal stress UspA family protein